MTRYPWAKIAIAAVVCLTFLRAGQLHAAPAASPAIERVVVVMRHGVRPPTKARPLPDGYTQREWPTWPVPPGWLTPHGAQAIALAAQFDANRYRGLLPARCPTGAQARIVADTDERTLHTARVYADTLFPACHVPVESASAGTRDPRFSPFDTQAGLDPASSLAAAQAALPAGGTAALDAANHARLSLLDTVLNCPAHATCHLADMPLGLSADRGRVRITGGIAIAASLAQTLLLEYAEGKSMEEVGWGQVSGPAITDLSSLHALEYSLIARPAPIARFGAAALLHAVATALRDPAGARYSVFVGHDTNIALIGGALGVHWQARGFAADDPSPGGALVFELWRDGHDQREVRLRYRSQSLDEIRQLTPLADEDTQPLAPAACAPHDACSLAAFDALVGSLP